MGSAAPHAAAARSATLGSLLPSVADEERRSMIQRLLDFHCLADVAVAHAVGICFALNAEVLTLCRPHPAWTDAHLAKALRALVDLLDGARARAASASGGCDTPLHDAALGALRAQHAALFDANSDAARRRSALLCPPLTVPGDAGERDGDAGERGGDAGERNSDAGEA